MVLAGLYGAVRLTGKPMREQRVLFAGAGASTQGIAALIVAALIEDGLTREEAVRRIWTTDSHGLVVADRQRIEAFKATYARPLEEVAGYACADRSAITLAETVANARPTVLIGTSATPGIFDEAVVKAMGSVNERPIIFPLSNPTSKAECTPEDALLWTEGRAIVATGSPFAPVSYDGRRHRVGQCNNAFVFPGIGLGLTIARARRVSDGVFLEAAKALAGKVTAEDMAEDAVYPALSRIRECSFAVACATIRQVVAEGQASPEILEDLERTVERAMWLPEYLPVRYEPWPAPWREDGDRHVAPTEDLGAIPSR